MSQARVYTSKFAARQGKTLNCGKCGENIQKGDSYRWYKVGFRSRYKHIRCYRVGCTPRPSELESSLTSGAYAAIEMAEDTLMALDGQAPDDDATAINEAVQGAAEGFQEVADQYREASDAMGGDYGAGASLAEKAQEIEDAGSELESWEAPDFEPDFDQCGDECHEEDDEDKEIVDRGDVEKCDSCEGIKQDWWTEQISAANDAFSSVYF